ncbi:hypothetical protein [Streptomyces sp. DSM 118878]
MLAIPGTSDPGRLADNVAAGTLPLTEEEVTLLDAAGSAAAT